MHKEWMACRIFLRNVGPHVSLWRMWDTVGDEYGTLR